MRGGSFPAKCIFRFSRSMTVIVRPRGLSVPPQIATSTSGAPVPVPPSKSAIFLPADQYLHRGAPTEWWWHVGTLKSGDRIFGFEINTAAFSDRGYAFSQVMLTDVANAKHYQTSDALYASCRSRLRQLGAARRHQGLACRAGQRFQLLIDCPGHQSRQRLHFGPDDRNYRRRRFAGHCLRQAGRGRDSPPCS